MKIASFALVLFASATAFAGDSGRKSIAPPEEDRWKFSLSMPGWLPSMVGDTGVNGLVSHVDLDPFDIFRRYDMVVSLRAEAEKGRFGIASDWLYTSISDGVGTDTSVKKLDLQVDQTIGELALRWRLIESPRGYFDVTAGVRYTNLYQKILLQPNDPRIEALADRLAAAGTLVRALAARELATLSGRDLKAPVGPLTGAQAGDLARFASRVKGNAAERSAAIEKRLRKILSSEVERTDDWWDPVIGMRARYNINDRFYLTAKGDIGGFGVGSEFTWQAEGALGCNVTGNIFAEIGYRAFGVDYDQDGLVYDVMMHGAQVTMGIEF